jgi:hypothetical protein
MAYGGPVEGLHLVVVVYAVELDLVYVDGRLVGVVL